ncbi:MAG: 30S ribosomal protein S8 [Anaerolineales bacterium]|uniref:30S ribosomal protein S8 n=1 Tax=Promineifilum sp. TaxID=2664178 RepID=UPI001DE52302|nr:30S ribosomal protein S8 [Anaerolineales bacterium]MCB8936280.1 30S ribosomal protein S8 [Promineifilum sp.]MCO5180199.1 30S ribosomal protein S8 [Promineifilum sp.]
MSMTDPIADMLTRMRNALDRQQPSVAMPHSKLKVSIAEVLKNEGYIENYEVVTQEKFPILVIRLRYVGGRRDRRSVINGLKRVSSPGRRIYVGKREIPWVLSGLGVSILTTSRGVMTDQKARQLGLGGELLCKVW